MSRKLYEQLMSEKLSLSYDNQHRGVTESEEHRTSKSAGNHHKQRNHGRASDEDELVKYMSNLPGYLERGKKNEKILNVGVLDWKRLEQWKYNHKHVPHRSSASSVSTSNKSSYVSADRLFRQSLKSHFMASPGHSDAIKSTRGSHINIGTHSKYLDDNLSQKHPKTRLKGCNRKYLDPYIDKERDIFPNDRMHYEVASCARLGKSTQDCGIEKRVDADIVLQHMLGKSNKFDIPSLRYSPQKNHGRVPDMPKFLVQKSINSGRASFSEKHKELSYGDFNYDSSHSCPLPDKLCCNNYQQKGTCPSSTDLESINFPSSSFSSPLSTYPSPLLVKMGISPSRTINADERTQTIAKTLSANGPPQELVQKVTSDKSRSSSPFRRLRIGIGYTSKAASARKEDEYVPHPSSVTACKSSSESVRGYASSKLSGSDKPGDAGRRRSYPFRRLQDPLLKPKTTKSRHQMKSAQEDSELITNNCRSADGKISTLQPDKKVEKDHKIDSSNGKKHVGSMTQALLRFAVRNGLPIFTFAVGDNTSNILAATLKNASPLEKDECNIAYTFFTFREVKKNGNWMNQTGRSKGPDYIPHAVAQMKVSDSPYYDLTSKNCVDSSTVKEFSLFSVNLRQENAQATDYQPHNELAAIIVKIPKAISCTHGLQSNSQYPIHATVLLPSGVHSLPSKGGPSSLIERWKSGGSCDCGGWDLACKLKVIATENQPCRKPTLSKAYLANQLQLFLQGNEQEHQHVFSFAPFKHGVYSIAFDSSLSLLQAFSICIALVDSKKPHDHFGSRNSIEDKNPRETLSVQAKELKAFGKLGDIPASHVSYPSLSPFGRV